MPSGWPENDGVSLLSTAPRALGICDYCGQTRHLDELQDQEEFAGFGLIDLKFRVCSKCYDVPQEQLRAIILPPDPVPEVNPRIENYALDSQLQGFSQNIVVTPPLNPYLTYAQLIAKVAAQTWGSPQPALTNRSTTLTTAFSSQTVVPAGSYTYILIYNPTFAEIGIALKATPNFSKPAVTTQIGGGTAMLQSAAKGQTVTGLAINAISTAANTPILIATG